MAVQLSLVGLYLGYIFELNNRLINSAWILFMVVVANITILKQSTLKRRHFLIYTTPAYIITLIILFAMLLTVFKPEILFSAQYTIPLGGMILGNILRSNIVGLERYYSTLLQREHEYLHSIMLGASRLEAIRPFLIEAYKAAILPQIGMVASLGLVSIPGMMTGQILGGTSPLIAVKYQIMIMVAIIISTSISVLLAILFSQNKAFTAYGVIDRRLFAVK